MLSKKFKKNWRFRKKILENVSDICENLKEILGKIVIKIYRIIFLILIKFLRNSWIVLKNCVKSFRPGSKSKIREKI